MPAIKKISTQRLIILSALIGLVITLGYQYLKLRPHDKVQAVGNLTFTFNGLSPEAPVFSINDLKPGDCYLRPVTAQNNGQTPAQIAVRSENVVNPDNLASTLFITISEGANSLYGGLGDPKTLDQFFTDSSATLEGLFLSTLAPTASTAYQFEVCMPKEAGNEWQRDRLVFDLLFGNNRRPTSTPTPTPTPSIPIPPECAPIAHLITRVFYGTEGNDRIHSGITNDLIIAYGGDDWIDASGGHDCVISGPGNDYVRTEDGYDIIVAGEGDDTLRSGSGNDVVYGNEGNDLIDSGSDPDLVYAGSGNDNVDAGAGDDQVWGGDGDDTIWGKTGNDLLYGEAGQDLLDGGSGLDQLFGGLANDQLLGGSGNDLLDGGPDNDTLTGNTGIDTCQNGETLLSCEL